MRIKKTWDMGFQLLINNDNTHRRSNRAVLFAEINDASTKNDFLLFYALSLIAVKAFKDELTNQELTDYKEVVKNEEFKKYKDAFNLDIQKKLS